MWLSVARLSVLALAGSLLACAEPEAAEVTSTADDEGTSALSDEGLDSSADALSQSRLPAGTVVYSTTRVNFRAGPSTTRTVLRVIPQNHPVTLVDGTSAGNGFYKVEDDQGIGYMHGAYLVERDQDDDRDDDGTGAVSSTGRRVSTQALYLGSCEFLGTCASSASRSAWAANRTIVYGCDGRDSCDNGDPYISVPRNGPACGATVRVCRVSDPSNCVNARVRERSDSHQRYELSPAAALGIDLDPHDRYFNPAGGEARCAGTLGGDSRVTISY